MTNQDEADLFFKHHRGGSGAVIVVQAFKNGAAIPEIGVFSCIELAEEWGDRLPNDCIVITMPYIVDDPDWGNEAEAN